MILIKYKPTTPSRRNLILIKKNNIWKKKPVKKLIAKIKRNNSRNNLGRITSKNKSKGKKKKFRIIDFKRNKWHKAQIIRVEYDPNRSSYISLIKDIYNNSKYYIITVNKTKINNYIYSNNKNKILNGNSMQLKYIPIGTSIHNIEIKEKKGGQLIRSAGAYATIINKIKKKVCIKLKSGEIKLINENCNATIGIVSNVDNKGIKLGKAGRNRWLGIKSTVRGVAKNPVDHPHGGGEGKTSGGRHPVTPWGKLTKGYKTTKYKKK